MARPDSPERVFFTGRSQRVSGTQTLVRIQRVWLHRSFGGGSVSDEAADLARQNGITVIVGACPMMFLSDADIGHRCMRWLLGLTGGLPKEA